MRLGMGHLCLLPSSPNSSPSSKLPTKVNTTPLPRSLSLNQTFQLLVCKAARFTDTPKECGFELRSLSWPALEPGRKELLLEKYFSRGLLLARLVNSRAELGGYIPRRRAQAGRNSPILVCVCGFNYSPSPATPIPAECVSQTDWPGPGRELVAFLPATVTGWCGCLLFTATHSHSPHCLREKETLSFSFVMLSQ